MQNPAAYHIRTLAVGPKHVECEKHTIVNDLHPGGAGAFPCLKKVTGAQIISMSGAPGPEVVSVTVSGSLLSFESQRFLSRRNYTNRQIIDSRILGSI